MARRGARPLPCCLCLLAFAAAVLFVEVSAETTHLGAGRALTDLHSSDGISGGPPHPPLRVWIDEFSFAEGETVLLREALAASGGSAVLAGDTRNRVLQLKSYQQAHKLDVMWTGRPGCYEAFKRALNASHTVSCVPGTQAVSGKSSLISSLSAAYGEAAWGIVPLSFSLPRQYAELAAHIIQEQRSGSSSLWVLKEDVHRGQGVGVVTPRQALATALARLPDPDSGWRNAWGLVGGWRGPSYKHVVAQRFLGGQHLVGGRPFYMRLWAVLLGADPARAYLYDGGVVVFGQQQRPGQAADALIVNLWTQDRAAAAPWSLKQLERHLAEAGGGPAAPQRLRRQLQAAVAASLAAGLPNVRRAAGHLPGFQGGSFEVLGIDFLMDASLRPWLVEVNFMPSLARKVIGSSSSGGIGNGGSGSGGSSMGGTAAAGGSAAASDDSGRAANSGSGSNASSCGSDASSSSGDGAGGCQQDSPFDEQKQGFVRGLLQLLTDRHRRHSGLEQQAEQVLAAASAAAAEGQEAPCLDAHQLRQMLAMQAEQAAAEWLGFISLTAHMYRSLGCMAAGPGNGSSATASSELCAAALAELAPPAPPPGWQECSAPATSKSSSSGGGGDRITLLGRLFSWCDWLALEAATVWPRLRNPVTWRRNAAPPLPAGQCQYKLQPSDQRMLAWMQRGSPPLSSPQAVHEFCGAATDAAASAAAL